MTIREAISAANDIRPNALDEKVLAAFLHQLDADFAEPMQVPLPPFAWPEDQELLMPTPVSRVYILWLCAMISYMQEDMVAYQIDQEQYSLAYEEARAWWRRHYRPRVNADGSFIRFPVMRTPGGAEDGDSISGSTDSMSSGGHGNWLNVSYNDLNDKPQIEGVTLEGNRRLPEFGLDTLTEQEIDDIIFGDG